jgi:hypothetical protein
LGCRWTSEKGDDELDLFRFIFAGKHGSMEEEFAEDKPDGP